MSFDQRGHAGDGGLGDGPDTRCAWPRAMSRHQKPFAVAVARPALLVCAWPPMDGAFLGLAPTHIPCATLMNANFKSIQVQTYSDPTHSVHKVAITRAWTPSLDRRHAVVGELTCELSHGPVAASSTHLALCSVSAWLALFASVADCCAASCSCEKSSSGGSYQFGTFSA